MRRKTLIIILALTLVTFGWSLAYEGRDSAWWPWVGYDQWPMVGYDAEASFSSGNWGPNPPEETAWEHSLDAGLGGLPILAGEQLIVPGREGTIQSLNRWTGDANWTHDARGGMGSLSSVSMSGRTVHAVTTENVLALDASSGEESWSVPLSDAVDGDQASVISGEEQLYVTGRDAVIAYDTDGGDTLWRHQETLLGQVQYHRLATRSEDELFVTVHNENEPGEFGYGGRELSAHHRLVGLDTATGDTTMDVRIPLTEGSVSQPVHEGDTVYLRAHSNIVAVDLRGDTIAWTEEVDSSLSNNVSERNGQLYTVTYDGTVFSLDLESREINWETDVDGSLDFAPNVGGEGLYLATGSEVVRLDRSSGEITGRLSVGGGLVAPIPANNHLYTVEDSRRVHALSN